MPALALRARDAIPADVRPLVRHERDVVPAREAQHPLMPVGVTRRIFFLGIPPSICGSRSDGSRKSCMARRSRDDGGGGGDV
jgi:hypothetical protein